jgi:ribosome biogenesis GTPase / thiamine phosphate phosphatase
VPLTTTPDIDLRRLGWDDVWAETLAAVAPGLVPGRISAQHRGGYAVVAAEGELTAVAAGRLLHGDAELPVVGDWVALDLATSPVVREVLPRRTAIARKAAGRAAVAQLLAANLDVVAVVASLEDALNPRRIERYLAAAWESGAAPVVVLAKADLRPDADAVAAELAATAFVPVLALSARTGAGIDALRAKLEGDRTLAFVGPSGAGKSTLVNRLLGDERQATHDVRRDGKGRHTTTHRELFLVPGGGVVVDTPGLRELGLWGGEGGGTDDAFADVAALALECRFADCAHESEPSCAVRAAIGAGLFDESRLESYRKLERELALTERRHDLRARAEEKRARRRQARSSGRASEGPWQS